MFVLVGCNGFSDGGASVYFYDTFENIADARKALREEYQALLEEEFDYHDETHGEIGDWHATVHGQFTEMHLTILDRDFNPNYDF